MFPKIETIMEIWKKYWNMRLILDAWKKRTRCGCLSICFLSSHRTDQRLESLVPSHPTKMKCPTTKTPSQNVSNPYRCCIWQALVYSFCWIFLCSCINGSTKSPPETPSEWGTLRKHLGKWQNSPLNSSALEWNNNPCATAATGTHSKICGKFTSS